MRSVASSTSTGPAILAQAVAVFRGSYATRIGDPDFEQLIAALREQSPEFVAMWEKQHTVTLIGTRIRLLARDLGPLDFISTRLGLAAFDDHVAFFLSPNDEPTTARDVEVPEAREQAALHLTSNNLLKSALGPGRATLRSHPIRRVSSWSTS